MKKAIFYIILTLLLVNTINADRTTTEELRILESIELENQNITLINLNSEEDKVILCINGIRTIAEEDKPKRINNVLIEVKDVKKDYAKIEFGSDCEDCTLNNNIDCFHECNLKEDCNDNNQNTIDSCIGFPRKCFYEEIPETPPEPIVEKEPEPITITLNLLEEKKENKLEEEPKQQDSLNPISKLLDFIFNLFN